MKITLLHLGAASGKLNYALITPYYFHIMQPWGTNVML